MHNFQAQKTIMTTAETVIVITIVLNVFNASKSICKIM